MKPSQILKRLEKLEKQYFDQFTELADEVLESRIIPYCKEHRLSFVMMNGIPRFINQDNEYVKPPRFIHNLMEITDSHNNPILWQLSKDFKFSDDLDFNAADEKHHSKKYAGRSLVSLVFSPAFSAIA